MTVGVQLDLFGPRRRSTKADEETLLARLKEVENSRRFHFVNGLPGYSPAAVRRLMRPLPPITVPR